MQTIRSHVDFSCKQREIQPQGIKIAKTVKFLTFNPVFRIKCILICLLAMPNGMDNDTAKNGS